jgi:hypothetical protein
MTTECNEEIRFEEFEKVNGLPKGSFYLFAYEVEREGQNGIEVMTSSNPVMMVAILDYIVRHFPDEAKLYFALRVKDDLERMAIEMSTPANKNPI